MDFHIEVVAFPGDSVGQDVIASLTQFGKIFNRHASYNPTYEEAARFSRGGRWLGRELAIAEVGCALAHLGIYERFLESKAKFCLVVESDVQLHRQPSLETLSLALEGSLPKVLILGFVGQPKLTSIESERLKRLFVKTTGTYAYALNRPAADLVLNSSDSGWLADWPPALSAARFSRLDPPWFLHPIQTAENSMPGREELYPRGGRWRRVVSLFIGARDLRHIYARAKVSVIRDMARAIRIKID